MQVAVAVAVAAAATAKQSTAEQSRAGLGGLLGTYLGYKDKDLKRRTKMTASACRRGRQAGRQAGE
jgi:hypothetical protein